MKSTTYRLLYAAMCAMYPERDPKSFTAREVCEWK